MPEVIQLGPRRATEPELRAIACLEMTASQFARLQIGAWLNRKNKPTKDEMMITAQVLKRAEDSISAMLDKPPSDGSSLDGDIETMTRWHERAADEARRAVAALR